MHSLKSTSCLIERLDTLTTWSRNGQRAPHKPLLIILALSRFAAGQRELSFSECRPLLTRLLREFGPSRSSYHPEYPFWRLQSDGLWDVSANGPLLRRGGNSDPTAISLLSEGAVGAFPAVIQDELACTPELLEQAIEKLLEKHFANSLHSDIRSAVGLPDDIAATNGAGRSRSFRREVLAAYRNACAVCGFSLRIEDTTIGLDAAHIKWRQANGPDTTRNGIALCVIHHKLFDLGAFTIDNDLMVIVSDRICGGSHLDTLLIAHHKRPAASATQHDQRPHPSFLQWHRMQVFKERPLP